MDKKERRSNEQIFSLSRAEEAGTLPKDDRRHEHSDEPTDEIVADKEVPVPIKAIELPMPSFAERYAEPPYVEPHKPYVKPELPLSGWKRIGKSWRDLWYGLSE